MKTSKKLICMILAIVFCSFMIITAAASTEPTSEDVLTTGAVTESTESTLNVYEDDCGDCDGTGFTCEHDTICKTCNGTGIINVKDTADSSYFASFWALVPPIIAIGLALITKEVYSSLFVGIAVC